MDATRWLLVIADDLGIGPETTRGILELAGRGVLTGTVLLTNTPYTEAAVAAWRRSGVDLEVGCHPNLTLDAPLLPAHRVPTLVGPDGLFWPLGAFLKRLLLNRIDPDDVQTQVVGLAPGVFDLVTSGRIGAYSSGVIGRRCVAGTMYSTWMRSSISTYQGSPSGPSATSIAQ